jgi:hypothetical protein
MNDQVPEHASFKRAAAPPSGDGADLVFLVDSVLIREFGWLERPDPGVYSQLALTPEGHLELERRPNAEAHAGFCAMWFAPELAGFYTEVVEAAVLRAGYEPLRLDHKEHSNPIDTEIGASIRAARFVVADLTGHRGGVYYEAGFAHGLCLPVIFMVREDAQEALHFDVQRQNFIVWQPGDLADARRRLANCIRSTLGQGPLDPDRA